MSARTPFQDHDRNFEDHHYVYPVVSRRAGGLSIGVNLSGDKSCNFRCVYCQVDRSQPGRDEPIDFDRLAEELERTVELIVSGDVYEHARFRETPRVLRRLSDIALSGNGEPTAHPEFERVVRTCAEVRQWLQLDDVKLVLITNASMLYRENVRRALQVLDMNHGEIWAKLDAGNEATFRQIARTDVPFRQILDNIRETAQVRPIVIQTLWMRICEVAPPLGEQEAYCHRLCEILAAGGRIKLVQIHTIARPPAESWVAPLTREQLESAAALVRQRTGLEVATFPA